MQSTGIIAFDAPMLCMALWMIWGGWIPTLCGILSGLGLISKLGNIKQGNATILTAVFAPLVFMIFSGFLIGDLLGLKSDVADITTMVGFYGSCFLWQVVVWRALSEPRDDPEGAK
jgi:hypothetical protein